MTWPPKSSHPIYTCGRIPLPLGSSTWFSLQLWGLQSMDLLSTDFLQNHSSAEGSLVLQRTKPAESRMMSKAMALNSGSAKRLCKKSTSKSQTSTADFIGLIANYVAQALFPELFPRESVSLPRRLLHLCSSPMAAALSETEAYSTPISLTRLWMPCITIMFKWNHAHRKAYRTVFFLSLSSSKVHKPQGMFLQHISNSANSKSMELNVFKKKNPTNTN